jgi:hypothetical protein
MVTNLPMVPKVEVFRAFLLNVFARAGGVIEKTGEPVNDGLKYRSWT